MPILGGLLGGLRSSARPTQTDSVATSGTASLDFTTMFGKSFVLEHNLESTALLWQMFITSTSEPRQVVPDDVVLISPNHIRIELQTPMDGTINIVRI